MGKIHAKIGKCLTRTGLEEFYRQNLKDVTGDLLEIGSGSQNISYNSSSKVVRMDIKESDCVDVVADAHELPFDDNSYDAVIAKEVLEHLHHPHVAIDEIFRVLKPGGKFVASTCFYWPIHGQPVDYFRFTSFGVEKLLEKWTEVRIVAQNGVMGVLGIHLVRLAGGKRLILTLLYPLIILLAFIFIKIDKLLDHSSKPKHITSRYYITAVKPIETE